MLNRAIKKFKNFTPILTPYSKASSSIFKLTPQLSLGCLFDSQLQYYSLVNPHQISRQFGFRVNSRGGQRRTRTMRHNRRESRSMKKGEKLEDRNLSFNHLNLVSSLYSFLDEAKIYAPTPIQNLALEKILQTNYNFFIGSQTGSGKTLTYLLPIFQKIKEQELELNELGDDFSPKKKFRQKHKPQLEHFQNKFHYQFMDDPPSEKVPYQNISRARVTMANRPRALIILPSKELVEQVTAEAKAISNHCKMSVLGLGVAGKMNKKGQRGDGGVRGLFKREREALNRGVDIVIGTLSR